ncbi:MAG: hypothetical protein ACRDK5_11625 [Solirubrobacterales bacterium]
MFSALLAGALIAGASLLLGAAIMTAAGRPRHSAAGPAVGLSALLVVCGIAIKLPGHGVTAAVATGLALVAALRILERSGAPLGKVRVGAIIAVVGVALVVAIPFATNGRVGILGQGLINDDMASHLLFTEWVDSRDGPTPDLVNDGYPLGPHAIAAATAKVTGVGLIEAFAGLTGAIAMLAALTAYAALGGVRELLRAPAAVLGAMSYLFAAYLAQGAFKEPMLGLQLLGFAMCLPALQRQWDGLQPTLVSTLPDRGKGWLRATALAGIPTGVTAAGTIYNYSFPGLGWLILAIAAWGLLIAWRERPDRHGEWQLRNRLRWARPALIVMVGITVLALLTEIVSLVQFASFEAFSPTGEGGNTGFGNLRQPLNPLEALGIWPSSEFRIAPKNASTPEIAFWLGGLLSLTAFAWGLGRALARREAALPAALAAGAVGYLAALAFGTPYTSAKSLAIVAPVVMVIVLRGLLAADALAGEESGEAGWWPPRTARPLLRLGLPALTLAFVAAAALSTLLPLRQSAVGPDFHPTELQRMRPLVDGQKVLFLGRDNFISWELIGSEVYAPIVNYYDTEEVPSLYRATPINAKFDWDNVPVEVLDDFDWVLTTNAAEQSETANGFERALETEDFVLWHRVGATGERRTLLEPLYPGSGLDCSDPNGKLAGVPGTARVLPRDPVVSRGWSPDPDITEATGAGLELPLVPGRWDLSIQYASTQEMRIDARARDSATREMRALLERTMRANLLFRGPSPFYRVGTIEVRRPGPVGFEVSVERPPLIGRLLGTEGRAYLGTLAATPADPARETVALGEACGRYVDWYTAAPGTPPEALAGVEAPVVHPVDEE